MFSRVSAEGQIHSNLQSVISKLNNEGTLEKLYGNFKNIFENEVSYTLNGRPPFTQSSSFSKTNAKTPTKTLTSANSSTATSTSSKRTS
jgi:hypothetical protein